MFVVVVKEQTTFKVIRIRELEKKMKQRLATKYTIHIHFLVNVTLNTGNSKVRHMKLIAEHSTILLLHVFDCTPMFTIHCI